MKPALTIHIGRPKTGSTALQHFLMKNRKQLLERGILYPLTGCHQLASHLFPYAYLDHLRENALLAPIDRKALWGSLAEEVAKEGAEQVVLSSENFWFVDPREVAADLGDEYSVRIVACLRRQDNVIASSFCEEVKRELISLQTDVKSYALHGPRLELLDYRSILDSWADCFGTERVEVRVYESLPEGGIAEDFCRLLDIEYAPYALDQSTFNPALPYDVLSLISNMGGFNSGDGARRRFVTALSEAVVMLDPDPRYDSAGLFPAALRQEVMQVFEASNNDIASRYLASHAGPLFPPVEADDFPAPSEEVDSERVTRLLLGLHAHQERTHMRMLHRLSKLERQLAEQGERITALMTDREDG